MLYEVLNMVSFIFSVFSQLPAFFPPLVIDDTALENVITEQFLWFYMDANMDYYRIIKHSTWLWAYRLVQAAFDSNVYIRIIPFLYSTS